ncbi:hypothetical protein Tcan_07803 [Toxocara canis]|nr:hypothetical protein Tcan_07803 [Toxocara canis]
MYITDFLKEHRKYFIVGVVLYALLPICVIYKLISYDEEIVMQASARSKLGALTACVLAKRNNFWNLLESTVTRCVQKHVPRNGTLNLKPYRRDSGLTVSYFLKLRKKIRANGNYSCFWLILGSKQMIIAQTEFKQSYPRCKIFRLEQFSKRKIIEKASNEPLKTELDAMLQFEDDPSFLETLSPPFFRTLLHKYLKTNKIPFVSINMDGYEYVILKSLINPSENEDENVVFCQIDVVLSSPNIQKAIMGDHFNFDVFITRVLERSPYVPIHVSHYLEHLRVLFIHSTDSYCYQMLSYVAFSA